MYKTLFLLLMSLTPNSILFADSSSLKSISCKEINQNKMLSPECDLSVFPESYVFNTAIEKIIDKTEDDETKKTKTKKPSENSHPQTCRNARFHKTKQCMSMGLCTIIDEVCEDVWKPRNRRLCKIYDDNKNLVQEDIFYDGRLDYSWNYIYNEQGQLVTKNNTAFDKCELVFNSEKRKWEWKTTIKLISISCLYDLSGAFVRESKSSLKYIVSYAPVLQMPAQHAGNKHYLPASTANQNPIYLQEKRILILEDLNRNSIPQYIDENLLTGDEEYDSHLLELWYKYEEETSKAISLAKKEYQEANKLYDEAEYKQFWQRFYFFYEQTWKEEVKAVDDKFRQITEELESLLSIDLSYKTVLRIKEYWLPAGCLFICDARRAFPLFYDELYRAARNKECSLTECNTMFKKLQEAESEIMNHISILEQKYQKFLDSLRCYPEFDTLYQNASIYYKKKAQIASRELENFWQGVSNIEIDESVACFHMKGQALNNKGHYEEAIPALKKALKYLYEQYDIDDPLVKKQAAEMNYKIGICYSECNAFDKAISCLNNAIKKNPYISDAYLERAAAQFEQGHFEEALKDYELFESADEAAFYLPPESRIDMLDFGAGLIKGVSEGTKIAAREFVPTLLKTPYALGQFTWTLFTDSSLIREISGKTYDLIEHIVRMDSEQLKEDLIYPLYELTQNWMNTPAHEKGNIIGYNIGLYGIDSLIIGGAVKTVTTVHKLDKLKKVNKVATFKSNPATSTRAKLDLIKSLHSQHYFNQAQDLSCVGTIFAGAGTNKKIEDLPRLIATYGGNANTWVKKATGTYGQKDLFGKPLPSVIINGVPHRPVVSCHWYENIQTGKRYEIKTKVYDKQ